MTRLNRLATSFAMIAIALGAGATPAFAEFESKNKESSKGTGEVFETVLEAGGATVKCEAYPEASSSASWTIVKAGVASIKGPGLQTKVESWGECKAAAKGIKEVATAKLSGCEFEITESESQGKVPGKLLKVCKAELPLSCTITLEPGTNSSLESVGIHPAGEESESTALLPVITNAKTAVSAGCEAAGVKSTSEGKIDVFAELYNVKNPIGPTDFKKLNNGNFNETSAVNSTSSQQFVFIGTTGDSKFLCTSAVFTGSLAVAEAQHIEVAPVYSTCKEEVNNLPATVTVTNCRYKYTVAGAFQVGFVGWAQLVQSGGTCEIKLITNNNNCKIVAKPHARMTVHATYINGANELGIANGIANLPYKVEAFASCAGFAGMVNSDDGSIVGTYKINNVNI